MSDGAVVVDGSRKAMLDGSGVAVTKLGAWSWGDTTSWNDFPWDDRKLKAAKGAFDASIDSGITFFDTAEVYGAGCTCNLKHNIVNTHINSVQLMGLLRCTGNLNHNVVNTYINSVQLMGLLSGDVHGTCTSTSDERLEIDEALFAGGSEPEDRSDGWAPSVIQQKNIHL